MSGFKYDVVSILRHNVLVQPYSLGAILANFESQDIKELYNYLSDMHKCVLTNGVDKLTKYNFIVIDTTHLSTRNFLKSLTELRRGGLIILNITGKDAKYQDKYLNIVGGTMSATKLRYEDRSYIVIHTGEDYGD